MRDEIFQLPLKPAIAFYFRLWVGLARIQLSVASKFGGQVKNTSNNSAFEGKAQDGFEW